MISQKNREPGFYLVKFKGRIIAAEWTNEYDGVWLVPGSHEIFWESQMEDVYHRITIDENPAE